MPHFRGLVSLVVLSMLALTFAACSTVPVTGRRQLDLVPAGQMLSVSNQQYNAFLQSHTLSNDARSTQMVKRVGGKIRRAVERYFAENDMGDQLEGYQWEFNLIEDKQENAWAMPGGKVVVYTGILPITRDETGLAVVLGHEIAHAVAQHGDERLSQGLLAQLGGVALATALSQEPEKTRQLWMTAYGVGAQVGALLPFSRLQESEADHLGLIFMAMAGYNPEESVGFWQRMSRQAGSSPPEFLSTHPSSQTRIENLRALVPEAKKYYR